MSTQNPPTLDRSEYEDVVLDERFDIHVSRPLADRLGAFLHARGVSADAVTAVVALCGVAGGVMFAFDGLWPIVGGLLVLAMSVLDCVDGVVARLAPPSERPWRGRMLDGWADFACAVSIHAGMSVNLYNQGVAFDGQPVPLIVWLGLGALGFVVFSYHSQAMDHAKHRMKPSSPDRDVERWADQDKTLFERFLYWSYKIYVSNGAKDGTEARVGDVALFRGLSVFGPTHRFVGMALAGILTAYFPTIFLSYMVLAILSVVYTFAIQLRARRERELHRTI